MKKKKSIIFIVLAFVLVVAIGGTIAYYRSNDTFTNEFNTSTYSVQTVENFESPDNWTPGTTTPKVVYATNTGETPIVVRIKLEESWQDSEGNPLPLQDEHDNDIAIINFANDGFPLWNYNESDGYFYYYKELETGESTEHLIESVTFDEMSRLSSTKECDIDPETNEKYCETTYDEYGGGKYILRVTIETAQYNGYQDIWHTNENIDGSNMYMGMIKYNYDIVNDDYENYVFGKTIERDAFQSIITLNNKDIPNDAIESWDASQLNNGLVMAWYKDEDDDGLYELYLGADGGVKANVFSDSAFSDFINVHTIDLTYLDTSNAIYMDYMFAGLGEEADTVEFIGIENFNTSNVVSMENMFSHVGETEQAYDLSNWDISGDPSMSCMFRESGFNTIGTNEWNTVCDR